MPEWLRDPTLEDAQNYRDIVEAISDYYGEKYASKLIIWLTGFIPGFVEGSREET